MAVFTSTDFCKYVTGQSWSEETILFCSCYSKCK